MSDASSPVKPIPVPGDNNLVTLLLHALEFGASDVHLSAGYAPMFRLHGSIVPTDKPVLEPDALHNMLYDLLDDDKRKRLERDKELDFALQLGDSARFRVNCFYNMKAEGAVFRNIPSKIKSFEELDLPPILRTVSEKPRGIVLVTGPTGSGKSTTLAAMVDHINANHSVHILTIEDPIEFVHKPKRSVVNQRELGANTHSFTAALRSALREDPDVILVGEMRDLETISLALTAAETGHLVFGTLHTQSAPKTVDRLVDVFPPEQQGLVRTMFAESFQAIICQTLIPKKSGTGRVCAMEIMIGTPATRSLIRESKTHQLPTIIQTSQKLGMKSLDQNLKDLVMQGVITEEAALEKANNPDFISRKVGEKANQEAGSQPGLPSAAKEATSTSTPTPPAPPPPPASPAPPEPKGRIGKASGTMMPTLD